MLGVFLLRQRHRICLDYNFLENIQRYLSQD